MRYTFKRKPKEKRETNGSKAASCAAKRSPAVTQYGITPPASAGPFPVARVPHLSACQELGANPTPSLGCRRIFSASAARPCTGRLASIGNSGIRLLKAK